MKVQQHLSEQRSGWCERTLIITLIQQTAPMSPSVGDRGGGGGGQRGRTGPSHTSTNWKLAPVMVGDIHLFDMVPNYLKSLMIDRSSSGDLADILAVLKHGCSEALTLLSVCRGSLESSGRKITYLFHHL